MSFTPSFGFALLAPSLDNELRFIFLDLFVNSICIKPLFLSKPTLLAFTFFKKSLQYFHPSPKKIFMLQTMIPLQSTFTSYALMMVFIGNARLQQI
jgi:hypothetical protein